MSIPASRGYRTFHSAAAAVATVAVAAAIVIRGAGTSSHQPRSCSVCSKLNRIFTLCGIFIPSAVHSAERFLGPVCPPLRVAMKRKEQIDAVDE